MFFVTFGSLHMLLVMVNLYLVLFLNRLIMIIVPQILYDMTFYTLVVDKLHVNDQSSLFPMV